jgi:hypothetical protein
LEAIACAQLVVAAISQGERGVMHVPDRLRSHHALQRTT